MLTPSNLPGTTLSFTLSLPASEEWFALWLGAQLILAREYYWTERASGLTVAETVDVWVSIFHSFGFGDGV